MIYDCFLFHNELDLLEIRLNELKDVVDRHVLVESTITFQHNPKSLHYEQNKERFKEFHDKIIHIVVDDAPTTNPWDTEFFQRNAIRRGLGDCKDEDLIIVADADEIPSPFALNIYQRSPVKRLRAFKQIYTHYYFNCVVNGNWALSRILPYEVFRQYPDVQQIRESHAEVLFRGGWHFSYLGDWQRLVDKVKSFSHTELNDPFYINEERVKACIEQGLDFTRPRQFEFVPIDDRFPLYIRQNTDKFSQYIKA